MQQGKWMERIRWICWLNGVQKRTFYENNTDNYYTINDKEFEEKAGDSLKRQAIYAGFAENEVQEIKIKTISGKKVVTRIYKQFIDISIGFFLIEAKPEILQYFYQVGVGGHSSMGYGRERRRSAYLDSSGR